MIHNKGFQFRLYPNKRQATFFNKTIGCARFVFNFFVGKQKDKDAYWYIVKKWYKTANSKRTNGKVNSFVKTSPLKPCGTKEHYPF